MFYIQAKKTSVYFIAIEVICARQFKIFEILNISSITLLCIFYFKLTFANYQTLVSRKYKWEWYKYHISESALSMGDMGVLGGGEA